MTKDRRSTIADTAFWRVIDAKRDRVLFYLILELFWTFTLNGDWQHDCYWLAESEFSDKIIGFIIHLPTPPLVELFIQKKYEGNSCDVNQVRLENGIEPFQTEITFWQVRIVPEMSHKKYFYKVLSLFHCSLFILTVTSRAPW